MRICILGNAQSPHIVRWAEFFTGRGHAVDVVSARPDVIPGARVHSPRLPLENRLRRARTFDEDRTPNLAVYLSYVILGFTIRRLVRRFEPDIIMAMTMETNGVLAMIAGHHPTALFHLGPKALSIRSETSLTVRLLVKAMLRFSDMIYTGDSAGVGRLESLGTPRSKIYVNPWGIDRTKLAHPMSGPLRERLAPGRERLFVCMRVFLPEYDVATYLRAIPSIVASHPEARFVVVGDGPLEGDLKRLADRLEIAEHVEFVGYVPYDMLFAYAAAADFYVDPLNFQLPTGRTWWGHRIRASMDGTGYSITLLLAMASRCVPLVTRRAGLSDLFGDEVRPLVSWSPGEPEDLAEKAIYFLENEAEADALRTQLVALAEERFDWTANARRVEQQFVETVEEHRDKRGPV